MAESSVEVWMHQDARVPVADRVGRVRSPAVAGAFYPAGPRDLADLVDELLVEAARSAHERLGPEPALEGRLVGLLVPHAGLQFSGAVAAAAWRLVGLEPSEPQRTIVLLGTNHGAGWLRGVGVWDAGAWRTPLGDIAVDAELGRAVCDLGPPFVSDPDAHLDEHSIEVQLPFLQVVSPEASILPLAVSAGTGPSAIAAGERLGRLLAARCAGGRSIVLVISSDMAHYPARGDCTRATAELLPPILHLDPTATADIEEALVRSGTRDLVCGMCGIQPTVLGLGALRAMGAHRGVRLDSATSADRGGPDDRTVGYLAAAFPANVPAA